MFNTATNQLESPHFQVFRSTSIADSRYYPQAILSALPTE